VNVECDVLAKYVDRLMEARQEPAVSRLSVARLIEEGFLGKINNEPVSEGTRLCILHPTTWSIRRFPRLFFNKYCLCALGKSTYLDNTSTKWVNRYTWVLI